MKKVFIILSFVFISIFITACTYNANINIDNEKIKVAVTIMPEAGLVKAIGGDLVEVQVLVPKGASSETYEATPKDIADFKNAEIYFSIGVPAESSKIFSSEENLNVVKLNEKVKEVYPERTFGDNTRDPHIWLSIKRAVTMLQVIKEELSSIDPENKAVYQKNMEDYIAKLENLDQKIKDELSAKEGDSFIIFHPALGYFAEDYNLKMYALEEEVKEATPSHLTDLIDLAKSEKIKGLLMTNEVDSKQGESFAEEIKGKINIINTLDEDYYKMMENLADKVGDML